MSGRQLLNSYIHRVRTRDIAKCQVLCQRAVIELRPYSWICQDRFDLRAEQQALPIKPIIEGLDTQAVASDKQIPIAPVPNREGKHSAQMLNAILTIFFVKMDDGFGIALAAIAM